MTDRNLSRGFLGLAVALLLAIGMLTVVWVRVNDSQQNACRQVESIKTVLRTIVVHAAYEIGKPGTAGYAYYRAHPTELRAAKAAAQAELSEFAPGRC